MQVRTSRFARRCKIFIWSAPVVSTTTSTPSSRPTTFSIRTRNTWLHMRSADTWIPSLREYQNCHHYHHHYHPCASNTCQRSWTALYRRPCIVTHEAPVHVMPKVTTRSYTNLSTWNPSSLPWMQHCNTRSSSAPRTKCGWGRGGVGAYKICFVP